MIKIEFEKRGSLVIFQISGHLSIETAGDVEIAWKDQLNNNPEIIAFDLNGLEFIDSMGISHLIRMTNNSKLRNVELILFDLSEPIIKILESAGIDKYLIVMTKEKFESDYL